MCVCVNDNKQKGRQQQQVPTSTAARENKKKIYSLHVKPPPTQSVFSPIILYSEYILGRLLYSSRVERNTWGRFGTGTNGQVAVRQYARNWEKEEEEEKSKKKTQLILYVLIKEFFRPGEVF